MKPRKSAPKNIALRMAFIVSTAQGSNEVSDGDGPPLMLQLTLN
jgi:hypothetical protein